MLHVYLFFFLLSSFPLFHRNVWRSNSPVSIRPSRSLRYRYESYLDFFARLQSLCLNWFLIDWPPYFLQLWFYSVNTWNLNLRSQLRPPTSHSPLLHLLSPPLPHLYLPSIFLPQGNKTRAFHPIDTFHLTLESLHLIVFPSFLFYSAARSQFHPYRPTNHRPVNRRSTRSRATHSTGQRSLCKFRFQLFRRRLLFAFQISRNLLFSLSLFFLNFSFLSFSLTS